MRKLFSHGLIVFAGVVSLPVAISPTFPRITAAPDHYREDPRLLTLRKFFEKFDCPAWKYAAVFLEAADKNELDWRLLPSISFIESTGGKATRNNNLFGWGSTAFLNASQGIHRVGYYLAHSALYREKSLDELLATYNPNEEYAAKVKSVMQRISPSE
jgi:hypothetical protein